MTHEEWMDRVCALAATDKNAGRVAFAFAAFDARKDMKWKARKMAIATVMGLSTEEVERVFEAIAEAGLAERIELPTARA